MQDNCPGSDQDREIMGHVLTHIRSLQCCRCEFIIITKSEFSDVKVPVSMGGQK